VELDSIDKSGLARHISEICGTYTQFNNHTEALLYLAVQLPDADEQVHALNMLKLVMAHMGYLDETQVQERVQIANKIWKNARAFFPLDEDYFLIRKGF